MRPWWNWRNSLCGNRALNAQGLPRRPAHPNIERIEGQSLFGIVEGPQGLAHPCTVVDKGTHLGHRLPNGL
jgi:hypothetical protein